MGLTQPAISSALLRTLRRHIRPSTDLVRDLAQNVYVNLCKDGCTVLREFHSESPEAFLAYLKVIAASVAVDHLRASTAQKRGDGRLIESLESMPDAIPLGTLSKEKALEARQAMLFDVRRCVRSRTAAGSREETIFWMYYRDGWSAKDIAGLTPIGLSPKGVESVIRRVTQQVRNCLDLGAEQIVEGKMPGTPS